MNAVYPASLIHWAGHGLGGVRQPFAEGSGRPNGEQITTPLLQRLDQWADAIANGENAPRIVLLVGGPGNGKTDAIEGCIGSLDRALGYSGKLVDLFKASFSPHADKVPPRKVVVAVPGADSRAGAGLQPLRTVTLVQDATEEDADQPEKTAEQLLLDDLLEVSRDSITDIYLCCVNRGILSAAARNAVDEPQYGDLAKIIDAVSDAVTSKALASPCWPLDHHPNVAVWPMDVESLVHSDGAGWSVAHQIFEQLLRREKWADECIAGDRCPFCENQRLLSQRENLNSLLSILHRYELASGKRWSFRDLFSLIAYLLVGDFSELKIAGQQKSPCDWAASQLQLADHTQSNQREALAAPFLLASKLYYHRLFPTWPRLNSAPTRNAINAATNSEDLSGSHNATALFEYLRWSSAYAPKAAGDIPDRVKLSLTPLLDPARISDRNTVLYETQTKRIDLGKLEDAFSASVKQGMDLISTRPFAKAERVVLSGLRDADEDLGTKNITEEQKRLLQAEIRQFAVRFVKRSLATRRSLTRDSMWLDEFSRLPSDDVIRTTISRTLRNLLQENSSFRGAVATTFGQPVAQRSKDVVVKVSSSARVRWIEPLIDDLRPKHYMSFISVQDREIGVTFGLYKALRQLSSGLHEASLPAEVFALLDRVKAAMTGGMIRSEEDERTIILEGIGKEITVEGDRFVVQSRTT